MKRYLTLSLLAGSTTAAIAQPTVTYEALPTGCVSAFDITPDGRYVVGGFDVDGDFLEDGSYRYDTVNGTIELIADASTAALWISSKSISDDGTRVVGTMPDPTSGTASPMYAGFYDNTSWSSLGGLPGSTGCPTFSSGYSISGDGTTAVGLAWDGCLARAFKWTQGTGMTVLQVMGNDGNRASVTNHEGSIIAGFSQGINRQPTFWDGVTGLGTIIQPNGVTTEGEIMGMNDDGSIMLMRFYDHAFPTKDGWMDAYKWSASGGAEIIGTGSVFGGWAGNPQDIADDNGTIVGFDLMMQNRLAWIQYEGTGPCLRLDTFVTDNGGTLPLGQTLGMAIAVSNDGSRIVGHSFWDKAWMITIDDGCDADMNGDGILDNGDIGAFIGLFLVQDLAADFNGDGLLDNGDIGAFVSAFLAGC